MTDIAINGNINTGTDGNDTYIISNEKDIIVGETCDGGRDTVKSFVSYTLGDNVENLTLLENTRTTTVLNGQVCTIYGFPTGRWNFDLNQGDGYTKGIDLNMNGIIEDYEYITYVGTCGSASIENLLIQAGKITNQPVVDDDGVDYREQEIVQYADSNNLLSNDYAQALAYSYDGTTLSSTTNTLLKNTIAAMLNQSDDWILGIIDGPTLSMSDFYNKLGISISGISSSATNYVYGVFNWLLTDCYNKGLDFRYYLDYNINYCMGEITTTNVKNVLNHYGVSTTIHTITSSNISTELNNVATQIKAWYGVIAYINKESLNPFYKMYSEGDKNPNHYINIVGVLYDNSNNLKGFAVIDSNMEMIRADMQVSYNSRYVKGIYTYAELLAALSASGSALIYTDSPIKQLNDNTVAVGNSLNNYLTGNSENNILNGLGGNDTLNGGIGADTMYGGTGNDQYYVDNTGDLVVENPNEGVDLVNSTINYSLGNNIENLTLLGTIAIYGTGNDLNNNITGNYGNNILSGGAGNDVLNGGAGADTMYGSIGNDTYFVDNTGDLVIENLNEGTDLVYSTISFSLVDNLEYLVLQGTTSINGTGNSLNNFIIGNFGDNILNAFGGNDSMYGSSGNDTYYVDGTGDLIVEYDNQGIDLVNSIITYSLRNYVENLTLQGSGTIDGIGNYLSNSITGNSGNNNLYGLGGNDTLSGGGAADTLYGGTGNDQYNVNNSGDLVVENSNEGIDLVNSTISYTIGDNIENLYLQGTIAINGTGNSINNVIIGNSGNNILSGGAGNDTIDGGAGADIMYGCIGNDLYFVENAGDLVVENLNEGTDVVCSTVSYTIGDNVENLYLQGTTAIYGAGNSINNLIVGNSLDNILGGGGGNDNIYGGLGNDTYYVDGTGDILVEYANQGTDLVYSSDSYAIGNNIENLILQGTSAINGTGNSGDNLITGNSGNNILSGADGNDSLSGIAGNDTIYGGTGNDTIDSGTGADIMYGGTGNDIYYVDNTGDLVIENAYEGNDIVYSSVSYSIGNNIENLTLQGSSAINATGNSGDNLITGNSGNNILSGGAGNDTLNGLIGPDTLYGGAGNDRYVFNNGFGIDFVQDDSGTSDCIDLGAYSKSSVTFAALDSSTDTDTNLDSLKITINASNYITINNYFNNTNPSASSSVAGTGCIENIHFSDGDYNFSQVIQLIPGAFPPSIPTEGADSMVGTANNDTINGLGGNDTILGLGGNDYLTGGLGDDSLVGGTGSDTLIGSAGNDHLDGSSGGNDYLDGTLGTNDTIIGAPGNDSLFGGAGNDSLFGNAGNDIYHISTGSHTILDSSGAFDYLDLGATSLSYNYLFTAQDLDQNGKFDTLGIQKNGTNNQILIKNYFDNLSAKISSSKAGTGCIETIHFSDADLAYNQILQIFPVSSAPHVSAVPSSNLNYTANNPDLTAYMTP